MSMTTEGYVAEVKYVLNDSKLSACNFSFEPAQTHRLELLQIKYCLFIGDTKNDPIQAKLKKTEDCKWEISLSLATDVMNLSLAKINKARVRLVMDDELKRVESVDLV